MKIEHIAIWCRDLEKEKDFYTKYFNATAGAKYFNPKKLFESYFLTFDSGCRLELMYRPDIAQIHSNISDEFTGLTHFAISVESKSAVDELTEILRKDGYIIAGEPRTTGDGYYESVVLDPEGNRIEITV
jgi:lactoylglutathione lyase